MKSFWGRLISLAACKEMEVIKNKTNNLLPMKLIKKINRESYEGQSELD